MAAGDFVGCSVGHPCQTLSEALGKSQSHANQTNWYLTSTHINFATFCAGFSI